MQEASQGGAGLILPLPALYLLGGLQPVIGANLKTMQIADFVVQGQQASVRASVSSVYRCASLEVHRADVSAFPRNSENLRSRLGVQD